MKTLLITTALVLQSIGLFAQTTLTYANNALRTGDSYSYREIQFPDPGNAGSKQLWDYSGIQYTGKSQASNLQAASDPKLTGASFYNLSLLENGYDYFMNSSVSSLEECGYENNTLKLTLAYSDPVLKIKYPFAYGDQFTDHFIGVAFYSETNKIDFFGDHILTADAYGILILPDRILENTLRVKSVKKGLQINMCGMTDINIVKYSWYATGYRYPVLSISTVETQNSGGAPQITKSAFTNTAQNQIKSSPVSGASVAVKLADQTNMIANPDFTVALSPNPFTDKLTYNYTLSEPMTVSIELYSVSGKNIGWLVKSQPQGIGFHTGELDAMLYNLAQGVHFIRFTFNNQVIIRKIVKL
jgi:hypothetical protein